MPFYDYQCSRGHVTERFRPIADRDRLVRCKCKLMARRTLVPGYVSVIPDIREHFNPTIGEGVVVKNREHLKRLQQEHGLQDFDPKDSANQPSSSWQG